MKQQFAAFAILMLLAAPVAMAKDNNNDRKTDDVWFNIRYALTFDKNAKEKMWNERALQNQIIREVKQEAHESEKLEKKENKENEKEERKETKEERKEEHKEKDKNRSLSGNVTADIHSEALRTKILPWWHWKWLADATINKVNVSGTWFYQVLKTQNVSTPHYTANRQLEAWVYADTFKLKSLDYSLHIGEKPTVVILPPNPPANNTNNQTNTTIPNPPNNSTNQTNQTNPNPLTNQTNQTNMTAEIQAILSNEP